MVAAFGAARVDVANQGLVVRIDPQTDRIARLDDLPEDRVLRVAERP